MQTVNHTVALRSQIKTWRREGARIALVPTMGNLHAGHLALVQAATRAADRTLVTIFVNPTQFVAGEDYGKYPRTLAPDRRLLAGAGIDLLFAPAVGELYPNGLDQHTRVQVPALDHILCGAHRPGHFTGVATVVTKLLSLMRPDLAFFGEKDYQQLLVIKRLVKDFCMDLEIHSVPTIREADGLALSSRNNYLTAAERHLAPILYRALSAAADTVHREGHAFMSIEQHALSTLADAGFRPEYFSIRRADDLGTPIPEDKDLVILAAAWLGQTRLIDNIAVHRPR